MCIGACGWYEMQWMARWNPEQKKLFHMRRYLDDVHMTFNKLSIEAMEIVNNFKERGACYPEALSLEGEDDNNEYLETNIIYDGDGSIMCKHRMTETKTRAVVPSKYFIKANMHIGIVKENIRWVP